MRVDGDDVKEGVSELEDIQVHYKFPSQTCSGRSLKDLAISQLPASTTVAIWVTTLCWYSTRACKVSLSLLKSPVTHLDLPSPGHISCPGCKAVFPTADHIVDHLNSDTLCWPEDLRSKTLAPPPAFVHGPTRSQVQNLTYGTFHPKSGYIFGSAPNLFEQMQQNEFEYHRLHNAYYPFKDQAEWELGWFICLCQSVSASNAERFLKLQWVCTHIFKLVMILNLLNKVQ